MIGLNKKLFANPKIAVLSISSFVIFIICLVGCSLLGWKAHMFLTGGLPYPVDKANLTHWIRLSVFLLFFILAILIGNVISTLISLLLAKFLLQIPRYDFEQWLDSTNNREPNLRKWNNHLLNQFYK